MSTITLTKWGNSIGIRIPSAIIKEAHLYLGETLEIKIDKTGELRLIPMKNQQNSWLEKFNAVADADSSKDEGSIDIVNDFDKDEWTW